jgi:hypothetical protein
VPDDNHEGEPVEEPSPESEPSIVELPEGPENLEYRGGRPFDGLLIRERDQRGDGKKHGTRTSVMMARST